MASELHICVKYSGIIGLVPYREGDTFFWGIKTVFNNGKSTGNGKMGLLVPYSPLDIDHVPFFPSFGSETQPENI